MPITASSRLRMKTIQSLYSLPTIDASWSRSASEFRRSVCASTVSESTAKNRNGRTSTTRSSAIQAVGDKLQLDILDAIDAATRAIFSKKFGVEDL